MDRQIIKKSGFYLLAIVFAVFTAYSDLRTDDTQFIALFLLLFGGVLGAIRSQKAWLWALLIGLPIPALEIIRRLTANQSLGVGNTVGPFLALIFAFAGVYFGAFVAKSFKNVNNE